MVKSTSVLAVPAHVSLQERLKDAIGQAILRGELAAGQKLNAGQLARDLGVSVIPIREALQYLAADGWVVLKPNVGAFVRERTRVEAQHLHEVRELLEPEIAALAARRRTADAVRELNDLVQSGEEAASEDDAGGFGKINTAFHAAVAASAGNSVLAELHARIALRVQFYFASAAVQRVEHSAREHRAIASAIAEGNSTLAARLAGEHARATRVALEDVLSRLGEQ